MGAPSKCLILILDVGTLIALVEGTCICDLVMHGILQMVRRGVS
jgi:hypothetical protein